MSNLPPAAGAAKPATAAGAKAFTITPFTRLARTHAASTMADAMLTAALAGSLFFSLPAGDARGPVLRYLVITMLPFAVLSPLIGPAIDRLKGGHRFMVIGTCIARVLVCYFMISKIGPASETGASAGSVAAFFLLALCILVAGKSYQVARSALVPTVVGSDEELVEANSKLSLISGISGFVGVVPAAVLLKLFGPEWAVGLAMITYGVAAVLATRIPPGRVATESADATERHELRGATIVMAGSAMGLIRAAVGFLTLLIAFDFRGSSAKPAWAFAVVGGLSVGSQLLGAAAAPRIRAFTSEENLLSGVLALLVVGGVVALILGDIAGAAVLGSCVGFAAGAGKLAFDSILQRDAPDANRGRAFAKFETRFQVTWVVGALIPVAFHMTAHVGFGLVFALAVVAVGSYSVARGAYAHRSGRQSAATAAAVEIEKRFDEVSVEFKGRLSRGSRSLLRKVRGKPDDPQGGADAAADPEGTGAPEPLGSGVAAHEATVVAPPGSGRAEAPVFDQDLASTSPTAWTPPPEEPPLTDYPWEPNPEAEDVPGAFLADVDPSVANPYPWTPDAPAGDEVDPAHPADDPTRAVTPEEAPTAPASDDPPHPPRRHHLFRPGSPTQVRERRRNRP